MVKFSVALVIGQVVWCTTNNIPYDRIVCKYTHKFSIIPGKHLYIFMIFQLWLTITQFTCKTLSIIH
jgi:hypothetical protein